MNLVPQMSHALRNLTVHLMAMLLGRSLSLASLITLLCRIATPALAVTYSDNGNASCKRIEDRNKMNPLAGTFRTVLLRLQATKFEISMRTRPVPARSSLTALQASDK